MARPKKAALVSRVLPGGEKLHPFQEQEAAGKLPVMKSVGFRPAFPGSREWVSYIVTSRGREVLSIEVAEPDLKLIATDEAKINFVTLFDDEDQLIEDLKHIEADKREPARAR